MKAKTLFVVCVLYSLVLSACNFAVPVRIDGAQSEIVCQVVKISEIEPVVETEPVEEILATAIVPQQPTATPAALPPIVEQPQPGPSCQAWTHGETRELLPGQTALGDVEVAGVVRYDVGGNDEGTVVVNLSSSPISIFAEWGAGCLVVTDLNRLVTNELFNTGCGPSRPCSWVRAVLVTDQGITETMYDAPLIQ